MKDSDAGQRFQKILLFKINEENILPSIQMCT